MASEATSYREDVEQLRRRFEEFRRTHAVRSRLPEELWAAAAELARRDGMDATAEALDVDKPSLRKWADRLQPQRQPRARRSPRRRGARALPAFVELLASGSGAATSCLVEVESPRGGKLRLELRAIETRELAELIRAFATS
jgi:Na+-transporting NADH:ubiquinone oxidoreductase subunit NqrF